jgi:hypothetical protein
MAAWFESQSKKCKDHGFWAKWDKALVSDADFEYDQEGTPQKNLVVEYVKMLKPCQDTWKLQSLVAKVSEKEVFQLFPDHQELQHDGNDDAAEGNSTKSLSCPYDHDVWDFSNYQNTEWDAYFQPDGRFAGAKCRHCKEEIPCRGPKKVNSNRPALVCRSLLTAQQQLYVDSCWSDGFVCHDCVVQKATSSASPVGKRARERSRTRNSATHGNSPVAPRKLNLDNSTEKREE